MSPSALFWISSAPFLPRVFTSKGKCSVVRRTPEELTSPDESPVFKICLTFMTEKQNHLRKLARPNEPPSFQFHWWTSTVWFKVLFFYDDHKCVPTDPYYFNTLSSPYLPSFLQIRHLNQWNDFNILPTDWRFFSCFTFQRNILKRLRIKRLFRQYHPG